MVASSIFGVESMWRMLIWWVTKTRKLTWSINIEHCIFRYQISIETCEDVIQYNFFTHQWKGITNSTRSTTQYQEPRFSKLSAAALIYHSLLLCHLWNPFRSRFVLSDQFGEWRDRPSTFHAILQMDCSHEPFLVFFVVRLAANIGDNYFPIIKPFMSILSSSPSMIFATWCGKFSKIVVY